jgi:nucleoside-diphosphate-sugar epimerase
LKREVLILMAIEKSVLVTGASGFIGGALCPYLESREWQVRKGSANAGRVPESPSAGWAGWTDKIQGCAAVVHLAARVHINKPAMQDSDSVYRLVNSEWTLSFARSAAAAGVRRFIFVSSVKVNGEGRDVPYCEADVPLPQDGYGRSKLSAEQGLIELSRSSGMEIIILRLPLVYGPRVQANFLKMMHWVNRGIPLPFASVKNRRSLLGIDNLSDAIAACLEHEAAANRTYVVSDQQDVSTPDLLKGMAHALNRKSRLFAVPDGLLEFAAGAAGTSSMLRRLCGSLTVDSSRISAELGWRPPISLEAGLQKTASWYRTCF